MRLHYILPFLKVFSFEKGPILISTEANFFFVKRQVSSSENIQDNIIRIKSDISNSVLKLVLVGN